MKLLDFYKSLKPNDKHLLKEFCWILEEKYSLNEADYLAGIKDLENEHIKTLNIWFKKKSEDYPLQYFLNSTGFLDLDFYVEEGVLIPRMETEDIVSWILDYYKTKETFPKNMIDIGSGSGCMGIALAHKLKPDYVGLLEPYKDARKSLDVNIRKHLGGESEQVELLKMPFEEYDFKNEFDLIVSNPPYIKIADPEVTDSVYKFEPHEALYGGLEGYETPIAWFKKSVGHLKQNGLLVFEMAYNQREKIQSELSEYKLEFVKDRFGKDRFFYYINE